MGMTARLGLKAIKIIWIGFMINRRNGDDSPIGIERGLQSTH